MNCWQSSYSWRWVTNDDDIQTLGELQQIENEVVGANSGVLKWTCGVFVTTKSLSNSIDGPDVVTVKTLANSRFVMELMGLVTEYVVLQLTCHCWSFSLWNVICFGDLYIVYFGWTVEIKTNVDVSWGIFTMWCVANVYFYCFVCSVGERSWEVLCSWWQTVSRTEQLHSVHWLFWQYFVVR